MLAEDDDLGTFGEVRYSMGFDGVSYFNINEDTGEVTTAAEFDREDPDSVAFTISGEVRMQRPKSMPCVCWLQEKLLWMCFSA